MGRTAEGGACASREKLGGAIAWRWRTHADDDFEAIETALITADMGPPRGDGHRRTPHALEALGGEGDPAVLKAVLRTSSRRLRSRSSSAQPARL
jgi:hypothetical protein